MSPPTTESARGGGGRNHENTGAAARRGRGDKVHAGTHTHTHTKPTQQASVRQNTALTTSHMPPWGSPMRSFNAALFSCASSGSLRARFRCLSSSCVSLSAQRSPLEHVAGCGEAASYAAEPAPIANASRDMGCRTTTVDHEAFTRSAWQDHEPIFGLRMHVHMYASLCAHFLIPPGMLPLNTLELCLAQRI